MPSRRPTAPRSGGRPESGRTSESGRITDGPAAERGRSVPKPSNANKPAQGRPAPGKPAQAKPAQAKPAPAKPAPGKVAQGKPVRTPGKPPGKPPGGRPAGRTLAGGTQPGRIPGRPPGSVAPGRRPAAGHDPEADPPPPPRPATRPALVRPATLFAITGVMLALLLGPYVRAWYVQRSEIAEQRAANAALKRSVDDLAAERARWDDPAYVRTQARSRLNYVLPGETGYAVIDDRPDPAASDPGHQAAKVADPNRAWYGNLWESVQLAGQPVPATKP